MCLLLLYNFDLPLIACLDRSAAIVAANSVAVTNGYSTLAQALAGKVDNAALW